MTFLTNRFSLSLASLVLILAAAPLSATTIAYFEEFDGNTNGYNPDSTTANLGDDDWVDFANRISTNFSGFEGYTTAVGGVESVLTGGSNSNDPQIRADFGFGIDKSTVTQFALRIRADVDQNGTYDDSLAAGEFNVFWGTDQYVHPGAQNGNSQLNFNLGAPSSLVAQTNGWHLATWDIPSGGLTAGTGTNLDSVRIDPTNSPAGNGDSFELDYFTISVIPEPTTFVLCASCIVGLCLTHRSKAC